jgi:hypothetical protein
MTTAAMFIVVLVVVVLLYWLSCWFSCCCCPSSQVDRRCHLHRRCRRNCILCSYHRRLHLAATFIAVVDAVIAPVATSAMQISSTQLLLAVAIATATAVVAAIAIAFTAAITATIAVTIAAASAKTTQFSGALQKILG